MCPAPATSSIARLRTIGRNDSTPPSGASRASEFRLAPTTSSTARLDAAPAGFHLLAPVQVRIHVPVRGIGEEPTPPVRERLAPAGSDESARSGVSRGLRFANARRELGSRSRTRRRPAGARSSSSHVAMPIRRLRRLRARQAEALEIHERARRATAHARVDHRDVRAHAVADDARAAARAERVDRSASRSA